MFTHSKLMSASKGSVKTSMNYYLWGLNRITYRFICGNMILNVILKLMPKRYTFKNLLVLIFLLLVFTQVFIFGNINYYNKLTTPTPLFTVSLHKPGVNVSNKESNNDSFMLKIPSEAEFRMNWVKNKLETLAKHSERWEIMKLLNGVTPLNTPSTRVHIFYHGSYENMKIDGEWKLWNQEYIEKKRSEDYRLHYRGSHSPPEDIASNYYPALGCYSSKDPQVIDAHFKQIRNAGIGVVVVSWYPLEVKSPTQDNMALLLNTAQKYNLKIALQIEMYSGRNQESFLKNINYIMKKYSSHSSFYKFMKNGSYLPVYYVYESYLTPASSWKELLAPGGNKTIRGTPHDGFFIGLLCNMSHRYEIERSHFDGFYTYFPSNGFSYGSSWKNWKTLEYFSKKRKILFFPSVSPGYVDTQIRPWNTALTRHRSHGAYYQVAWRSAIAAKPYGVSITSFNKWQDGSQIEPALPKATSQFTYLDYEPEGPLFYLSLTRYWVKQFVFQNIYFDISQ
uniref:Glycoprotein endo-alpha-1,2-mannosidase n=1 Tax=Graphocephala atropunctata TaxID=36148 RepID=A0A1B6M222_9HEMI